MTTDDILAQATAEIAPATDTAQIEDWRVRYLGRKGAVAGLMAAIPTLPKDERRGAGQSANQLKQALTALLDEAADRIASAAKPSGPRLDPTLPGIPPPHGHIHPVSRTFEEIVDAMQTLGFEVAQGPLHHRHQLVQAKRHFDIILDAHPQSLDGQLF